MTDKVFDNNQVVIAGEVVKDFEFSHDVFGEGFYILEVAVNRLSNSFDVIPLMISERLIDVKQSYVGRFIEVFGQFRSYNRHEENKNKLVLSVFVREVNLLESADEIQRPNSIFLDGYICKEPVYRKTPLGREIADLLLAVNRPYGKSDYIPTIAWGRNAIRTSEFNIGTRVKVSGRLQSREYNKKIDDEKYEERTAYELSASMIDVVEESEGEE